jgi:hypothetical protein
MQDSINLQARDYTGKGHLQICNSEIADCYINIHFRNDGKRSITCWFYLTNEYAKTLYDILEKETSAVVYATFKGEDTEGAIISIEKMALDETNFSANSSTADPKYIIRPELLVDILSKVGLASYAPNVAFQNFLNIVRIEFIMQSDIRIRYWQLQDEDLVSSRWGLTNFYFRSESKNSLFFASNNEGFSLKIGSSTVEIKK